MKQLNIALLQMTAFGFDQRRNLTKGEEYCRRAKLMGADIALFPEMWNIGYNFFNPEHPIEREKWICQAVGHEEYFITYFKTLAKELDMAIALTYLEKWPLAPRNSVSLVDRHGEIVLTYAKVHTCDFDLEAALTPGDNFSVCTLDTRASEVKVGAMICFDREFPESARALMLKGAEIILTPNACEIEQNRIAQFRARAFENMLAVAMTNYAAPQSNGKSAAFDGMAFDKEGTSRDMLVVEAGEREGIYIAAIDLAELRRYRQHEVWGNAFRKPGCYDQLVSLNVDEPFIRSSE